ncbi:pentatricopeptide repeat-containing protein At3g62470, mitochondrial-like [Zingiber officinale]|uniref:Pentatricopeptide repeat-containing protein n=1 Tax=Zingiber officinale TaxID=94328 RepID=A0A8J5BD76_ZINOF|nr:pentatricopeptide repeat-containing protein At3g62470, mitochondrial-like [Zingiber officinale]XP_042448715.1 pentatricopeptide repeat-containing protein At3g62470, mitochondrial-like [Zingiber officinale]XP_042448716.1 pentatricopeptide repeat-containing protein At3g62470, mitochondrial-like [Zingiber officinale]XP_042448717.1 pentatricopeptide repeat-containing protein At3g62470, mitochondrial-like [Zingiber officinale]XP_042448719.1 pentatricopeptide repeat-containing protein At3g62470, m
MKTFFAIRLHDSSCLLWKSGTSAALPSSPSPSKSAVDGGRLALLLNEALLHPYISRFPSSFVAAIIFHDALPPDPCTSDPIQGSEGRSGGQRPVCIPPLPLSRCPHLTPPRGFHCARRQVSPLLPWSLPTHARPPHPHGQVPPFHPNAASRFYCASSSASDSDADSSSEVPSRPSDAKEAERVCKVIDDLLLSDRSMEAVLDNSMVDLNSSLVVNVLQRFRHAHKPAYRFFRWAHGRPGFSHDSETYTKMLSVLSKTRQFETMMEFLEEMGRKEFLNMDAFKIAIIGFSAARQIKKSLAIFQLMKKFNFKAGQETFNCLIEALAKVKLGKEAQALFDKMKDQYPPDLRTYTFLLSGWFKLKNLTEASRVWNEMLDMGFEPDVVVYNTMIDGLILGHRRSDAIKLLELMKAKGPAPNSRTYTIVIQDLCKAGKMDLAVNRFQEMLDAGCARDVVTYTCLIVGFGNDRQMDKVSSLLSEMTEKGCPPDARTYNALIKLMTNRNMQGDAVRIYKEMIKKGFEPTIHTYNMLMKSCFHGNNYLMGCAAWEEMGHKGICPDINSYTVFIGGHIRHGRPGEACKYLEEMINKGMQAPQIDYNKFVADFARMGNPNILYDLAQKMNFSGKFKVSNVFHGWAERMKKRVIRRRPNQTGRRLF